MTLRDDDDAGLDLTADLIATFLADQIERDSVGETVLPLGVYLVRQAERREQQRVDGMLARDAEEAKAEEARAAASIELADGLTVNIVDTVVPPTPEWLAKHETREVAIGGEKWTDRHAHDPIRTVRRVTRTQIFRYHSDGRLGQRQFKACAWYRDRHELAGLDGKVKSTSFEQQVQGSATTGLPFTGSQIEAMDELRNARLLIPMRLRAFFDKVVIDDLSLAAAARIVHAGAEPLDSFKCCADRVADYVEYSSGKRL